MRALRIATAVGLLVSLLVAAPAGAAPSIDAASACVEPDGTFRFTVDVAETVADEIIFRLNADSGPFGTDLERFQVNFDAATGEVTRDVVPAVTTFGTPPFDRWVDGPVADYRATSLGAGRWRVEGGLAPGPDAFAVGDTVWGVVVRTSDGSDAIARDLDVTACDGATTATETSDFDIVASGDVPFRLFNVLAEGRVTAVLEWTGASDELTVQLTGRRRPALADPAAPYAEVTGTSPLTLTYDVTAADLARGTGWRLIVRDASGQFDAEGTIALTTPFDAAEQARFEDERIRLRSGDLWPSAARTAAFESAAAASGDGLHGIISLSRACNCQENRALAEAGFHRQSFLPGRDAFGLVEAGADRADPRIGGLVQFLTPLEPEDKIDPHVLVGDLHEFVLPGPDGAPLEYVRNADGTLNLAVEFHEDTPAATAAALLGAHAATFDRVAATTAHATIAPSEIAALAEHDAVAWIEAVPSPALPTLDRARANHRVDSVQSIRVGTDGIVTGVDGLAVYDGWTGNGVTVAVEEGDRIDATHPDLSRVVNAATDDFSSHKTHVAGTVAGTGRNSDGDDADGDPNGGNPFQWRGIAPEASLYDATNWLVDSAYSAIVNFSTDVSSHSHTMSYNGEYNSRNARLDRLISGRARTSGGKAVPRRPVSWAAGNEGRNNDPQYGKQPGMYGLTGQAKNLILVGNWCAWCDTAGQDPDDPPGGRLTRSSSMGPAHDGRLAPVVVAHGAAVVAPDTAVPAEEDDEDDKPGARYSAKTGTSMATPVVSGVIALLLQAWQVRYADPLATDIDADAPLPSTIRAVLAQTAQDVVDDDVRAQASVEVDSDSDSSNGNDGDGRVRAAEGPDYATGFGEVDAQAAVDLATDLRTEDGVNIPNRIVEGAVGQAGVAEYEFNVATTQDVKVTLAWDDVESATQKRATTPMLVNDLDVELVAPDGTVHYPWRLGHRTLGADLRPLPPEAQTPGTPIRILRPVPPADDTTKVTVTDSDGEDKKVKLFLDDIPQDAMDPGGAWVADRGRDHLNNIEQVLVENAAPGHWTARVIGFDVRTDTQDFSLVGMPYPDLPDIQLFAADQFGLPDLDEDVMFRWQAVNNGSAPATSGADYRILLSSDFVVDPGDVVLTDSSGPGRLSATALNSGQGVTSTIRITQADADAVLGTSGATVDDLVTNDVLLLLEVDPLASNEVLEHHEINVLPLSPGRLVDVVVVYDRSGSMNAGVPTSLGSRRKVEVLDDSAGVFFDLLRLGAGDRLGVVSFAGDMGTGTVTRDFDLEEVDGDNVGDAAAISGRLVPFGATDIRAGLEEALAALPAAGSDERRRVIVFFSDGERTAGADPRAPAFLDRFPDEDVRVFTVGFGTAGGSSYTGIDTALLQLLADANAGGFARVTDRPVDLDKFFVDALGGAIDWPTILDPIGDLAAGQTDTVDVGVTGEDGQAAFVLTWDDPAGDLELSLVTPAGTEIGASNAASFAGVERAAGGAHEIVKVQLPLVTGAAEEHAGTWQMRIRNAGSGTVSYAASAIARSTVRGEVSVQPPDDGTRDTGEPVHFEVAYRARGGAPFSDATVTVLPRVPLVAVGDVLAAAGLTPAEVGAIPADDNGDPYTDIERMIVALRDRWGTDPIPLADGTPFSLPSDGSGGFAGSFAATAVPGPYTFTVRSSFRTADCADTTREHASSVSIGPSVDAATSGVDLTTDGSGLYVLEVTPRDASGTYLGPGHLAGITTRAGGTLVAETALRDRLDGTYDQVFRATGSGTGLVEISALGVELEPQVVTTGAPVALGTTPTGGSTKTATTIAIFPGAGSDPTLVTSVSLVGASFDLGGTDDAVLGAVSSTTAVEATDVAYDPDSGTITATVPAGLVPGSYRLRLGTDDGADAASSRATFTAVGDDGQLPPALQAVLDSLGAVQAGEGLAALRALIRNLRALQPGGFLSAADITAAARAALETLLGVRADLDTDQVSAAVTLGTIDASFYDAGPQPVEEGGEVAVDLGNGATLVLREVTAAGTAALEVLPGPAEIDPSRRGSPHVSYDVTTTAAFGSADLTVSWPEGAFADEAALRIFHLAGGVWEDVTSALDPAANTITATVSSLSPFVVVAGGDPLPPPGPTCRGLAATLVGSDGPDELVGTAGRDVIVAGAGDDLVLAAGGDDVICAGDGDDEVHAGDGDDRVHGGDGDDELHGDAGDDALDGGPGDDELHGGPGNDALDGGPGQDELRGGDGGDALAGSGDGDALKGGDGPDLLRGGHGDDELEGEGGDDALDGGPGDDECSGERAVACEDAGSPPSP